jgi:hypothetical protein
MRKKGFFIYKKKSSTLWSKVFGKGGWAKKNISFNKNMISNNKFNKTWLVIATLTQKKSNKRKLTIILAPIKP